MLTMKNETIQIGIIGAGSFACRYHIPAIQKRDDAVVTAITKRTKESRDKVQTKFKIPYAFAHYEEMLENADLDAVIICSPHHVHYEQAKSCLLQGFPVLLEKPMTIEVDHARELVKVAEENDTPFLVAYNRRVDNRYREAARIIQDGGIGEVRHLEGRRFAQIEWMLQGQEPPTEEEREKWWPDSDRPNFRSSTTYMGEGFLDDGGSHVIDTVLWLSFSRPEEVTALMHMYPSGLEVRSAISLSFENGGVACISSSGDTPLAIPYETIVHGSEGAIALSPAEFVHIYKGKKRNQRPQFPKLTTTGHFIDVLTRGEEILCTAETAVTAVQISRAAFQSYRIRKTVSL